jgi:hypothetical protein
MVRRTKRFQFVSLNRGGLGQHLRGGKGGGWAGKLELGQGILNKREGLVQLTSLYRPVKYCDYARIKLL